MKYLDCGIYKWTNVKNGKTYIGQSTRLKGRKEDFLNFAVDYSGIKINNARAKYNHAFYWNYEILEFCDPKELNTKEKKYIRLYESLEYGYNMTEGGSSTYEKNLK